MADDLEQIITDSVNDSVNDVADTSDTDTPVDTPDAPTDASDAPAEAPPEESIEIPSPSASAASEPPPAAEDEFSKLVGMPQHGVGGRENRIPYSRVKSITENSNRQLAEAVIGRKLTKDEKPLDVVKTFAEQLPVLTEKVTAYETRLQGVDQFEQVMENDPERFLNMLARVPAYKEFFEFVREAAKQGEAAPAAVEAPPADPHAGMPEPDEELADGSRVYSMEGLKALLAWNAQQTESRVTSKYETSLKQLEEQYKPIRTEWETYHRQQAVLPTIKKQIDEAKTWAMFEESETEILEVLKNDKEISLEGAYRQVVFPKLIADRNKIRQEVIRDVKAAPVSSTVSTRGNVKPAPVTQDGPRSIEDIIREQVESLKK